MGCESSKKIKDNMRSKQKQQTLVGLLDINILNAGLYQCSKSASNISASDIKDPSDKKKDQKNCNAFVKLKVSNQQYSTRIYANFDKQGQFNSYFSFYINSCYRANGRVLQIQLKHNFQTSGSSTIAIGTLDLDPIINAKLKNQQIRCIISKNKPIGYVTLKTTFTQIQYHVLNFRFQSAILRNRPSYSIYNLRIEVQIGEEYLSTSNCKDFPDKPSSWINQILTFYVPKIMMVSKITVYDDDKYLGHFQIKLHEEIGQNQYEQKTHFTDIFNNTQVIGSLKYSTILGKDAKFTSNQHKELLHTSLKLNLSKKDLNKSYNQNNQSLQKILSKYDTKQEKNENKVKHAEFQRILEGIENDQINSQEFNKSNISQNENGKKLSLSLIHTTNDLNKTSLKQSKIVKQNDIKDQSKA